MVQRYQLKVKVVVCLVASHISKSHFSAFIVSTCWADISAKFWRRETTLFDAKNRQNCLPERVQNLKN